MLKTIAQTKEQFWNERFEKRMKERYRSQRDFIKAYKDKYGTGSQADVSKWMHVGDIDGRTKKRRGFPTFETMQNIADILEVSVGYLIGETDYETFHQERASAYLGLSSSAITAIRNITSGKVIPPFYKYPDEQRTAALESLLENTHLVDFLKDICDLAEAISREQNPKNLFEDAAKRIPEEYRDDAVALWADSEEAIDRGINPSDTLWAYVDSLDSAACDDLIQPDMAAREIKAARFALQETQIKMIDEFVEPKRLESLLPRYATKEELEALLKKAPKGNGS